MIERESWPAPILLFVETLEENARKAYGNDWLDDLVYVKLLSDGSWQMCDTYERLWPYIYRMDPMGQWFVRLMYCDKPEKPYTLEKAINDASMMFTG